MSDPALAMQKALFDALKDNTDAGSNVFDAVPSSDPFPRIVIGPAQTIGDFADCYDGSEHFVQIDVYSKKTASMPEVKGIASEVRGILHDADLTLEDGHELVSIEFRDVNYSREPDGKTARARLTFRAETQADHSP